MSDFVLEVGVEEIPARFLARAIDDLHRQAAGLFESHGIAIQLRSAYTPRRLVLMAKDVPLLTPRTSRTVFGPPRDVATDGNGGFTPAAIGFAKKMGVEVDELGWHTDAKGREVLGAETEEGGVSTAEALAEVIPAWLRNLHFGKNMRWEATAMRFARPIRWIVALLGEGVLDVEVAGVQATAMSRGHRFFGEAFEVKGVDQYEQALRDNYVLLDPDERHQTCVDQIRAAATKLELVAPDEDINAVIDEVANLVEWPVVGVGTFDESALALPQEVVLSPLRDHQRYISLRDKEGNLDKHFAVVTNYPGDALDTVIAGNERVLRARLSDARFFYEADVAKPLASFCDGLDGIQFHNDLGSVADKTGRVVALSKHFAGQCTDADGSAVDQIATLSRADLLTGIVQEFPEVQGVMGGKYARLQGLDEAIATGLEQFYQPSGGGFDAPSTLEGKLVALADRLDSLVGYFSVGLVPSGAKDPYALRRAARSIVVLALALADEHSVTLDLAASVDVALQNQVPSDKRRADDETRADVAAFINQRLEAVAAELDTETPVLMVRAVAAAHALRPEVVLQLSKQLGVAAVQDEDRWERLLDAAKRIRNILRKSDVQAAAPKADLLHPSARELVAAVDKLPAVDSSTVDDVVQSLYALTDPIDGFFEQVMVNDEDDNVRINNHRMLLQVRSKLGQILDFDVIVG